MTKKLDEMSVVELKAAAYDTLAMIQKLQQDLQVINNQVAVKSKEEVKAVGES